MAISLNGTTYNGGANPLPPDADGGIDLIPRKIGKSFQAANGSRSFVSRSATKREWALKWTNANTTTRTAVLALAVLGSTFTFVDEVGGSYTVQTEEKDCQVGTSFVKSDDSMLYNISLTIRQV